MPAVAIAHLLNPANIGQYDDPLLMEKAEEYVRETFDKEAVPKVISSLWCFVNKSGGFTDEMLAIFTAGMPPVVWWSQCPFGSQHEELRSLALKLLHIPATSAASERSFTRAYETGFCQPGYKSSSMFLETPSLLTKTLRWTTA